MPSGLIALLDDIAAIAKVAASSVDDVAAAAGKAGAKAAGVVIDDTAVTPRYVHGFTPDRELPIIAKITVGSLRNKLLILLPAALLLSEFLPVAIIPLLMLGGGYLAYEGAEKLIEAVRGDHHAEASLMEVDTPAELEKRQVKGAIRTDFILSAEIMAIALATLEGETLANRALALALVAVAVTVGVYGAVALIVKLDDIGLHLARRGSAVARRVGHALVGGVPYLLSALSKVGTAAMLWVGGGILLHGLEELHVATVLPETIHHWAEAAGGGNGLLTWAVGAALAGVVGLVAGAAIVGVVHGLMGAHATHGNEDKAGHSIDTGP